MCFLSKAFVLALLLTLTTAASPDECVHLNKTLSAEELHTIFGKWILHEAYVLSSHDYFRQTIKNTNSSSTEFVPFDNNQTVIFKQAIMMDETCIHYSVNFTVVGNTIRNTATSQNLTSSADFLKTCDDCLLMRYSSNTKDGQKGSHLLFYSKKDVLPQTDQEKAREQAGCLGFLQPAQFIYKQSELCPEQSETTK